VCEGRGVWDRVRPRVWGGVGSALLRLEGILRSFERQDGGGGGAGGVARGAGAGDEAVRRRLCSRGFRGFLDHRWRLLYWTLGARFAWAENPSPFGTACALRGRGGGVCPSDGTGRHSSNRGPRATYQQATQAGEDRPGVGNRRKAGHFGTGSSSAAGSRWPGALSPSPKSSVDAHPSHPATRPVGDEAVFRILWAGLRNAAHGRRFSFTSRG